MSTKVKWIAVGVVGFGFCALVMAAFLFGSGKVRVISPAGASVKVSIDGALSGTVPAGSHRSFSVEQGTHQVVLTASNGAKSQFELSVKNGAFSQLLPVGQQCFSRFDVTNFVYEGKKGARADPAKAIQLKEKYVAKAPINAPDVFFSLDELPQQIEQNARTEVLLDVPCTLVSKSEAEIIATAFN
jgi:hypothetical protein